MQPQSWYDPPESQHNYDLHTYMDEVRDQALSKLTNIEIAAMHNDIQEFSWMWRQEKQMQMAADYE